MAKSLSITPSSKPLKAYYSALRDLVAQEVSHEQAVRSAFQTLLTDLARPLKWTAIPELGKKVRQQGKKARVIPDGTLRDKYQLPRGYWEAKDSADDLDAEIRDKIAKSYPLTNTIFWSPARAVLFQDGSIAHDLAIDEANGNPAAFCDLLNAFFTYVDKPLVDFDEAVEEFTQRVPEVGRKLAEIIAEAHKSNRKFQQSFAAFFELCKTTLNPNIRQEAMDEMLVQHLLTARLFRSVFNNPEFLNKNVIAVEVEKVITALTSRSFSRDEFLSSLDRFYVAIENAAARVPDWSSKQAFLNTIYERFFQGYCVKTADTHGIVYTPQPIVDFMCASVEWVLENEFGKKLGDDGVNILDPCTGTGNFVVNLMRRAAERGTKNLRRMYTEQLFANEIMLMPYYIAALNIEHEYFDQTGEYEAFEGLCFVDTLDLAEARQTGLFTEANLARVDRQKKTPITVVIGNPPYNMGQKDENDNNKNRKYPVIDKRIQITYGRASHATLKTKIFDAYARFFRWATDRLGEREGIVCYVTNNSFLSAKAFDGMRQHLLSEFGTVYHVDLGGNSRKIGDKKPVDGNVFGIRVGVGITVAIRRPSAPSRRALTYAAAPPGSSADKLRWLAGQAGMEDLPWRDLIPQKDNTWLGAPNSAEYSQLMRIAAGDKATESGVFADFSIGVSTNRDSVVYGVERQQLLARVEQF